MNARELRRKFLEFFDGKDHHRLPSDRLVPEDPSLLFTSAGMVQLKPFFSGQSKPPHNRLTSCQKCLRTTDIECVGDVSHLTFFEMLGNFSVFDYFKHEALTWSWEFLTDPKWLGLDPDKLCVTVFEKDDEAFDLWNKVIGLSEDRIHRLPEDKNFWPANAPSEGPNGPCGPCSEIFYQTVSDDQMVGDYLADEAAGRWLEIWNNVFMQFERRSDPDDITKNVELVPLPKPCIDTGMGVERTAAALGGFEDVYEIDTMRPILDRVSALSGNPLTETRSLTAARIITDHLRSASFCIADGVLPQNAGRGYVLRRLIRRAVLKGQRVLGFERPFLTEVFPTVLEILGDNYPELSERSNHIVRTLNAEEEGFRRTLHQGTDRFMEVASRMEGAGWVFPGGAAFELHDTFGFPLEVTQELAEQLGGNVDVEGYRRAMEEQRLRSRSSSAMAEALFTHESVVLFTSPHARPQTEFVGYDHLEAETEIVQVSPHYHEDENGADVFDVALRETPFYAESGGQVGDTGWIRSEDDEFELEVTDTQKAEGITWHKCRVARAKTPITGLSREEQHQRLALGYFFKSVRAAVDGERRRDVVRNHTATHLLHAALRQTLGDHVHQAGSLVAPEHLRFDFTHGRGLDAGEIGAVEHAVNEWIFAQAGVRIDPAVPVAEAKALGAMALFGEKYGERVRVVEVPGISIELCGGCHVPNVSAIGLFKIVHESSAASGVRRIEAVTGRGVYEFLSKREGLVRDLAGSLKSTPNDLLPAVEKMQVEVKELRQQLERAIAGSAGKQGAAATDVQGVPFLTQSLSGLPFSAASQVADKLAQENPDGVVLVGAVADGKAMFVAKVGAAARERGAHAGNLVKGVAQVAGGSGGGRPDFAQAGAKDPDKVGAAMAAASEILADQLRG